MSKIKSFLTIIVLFIVALFVFGNNETNATSADTAIVIEKDTYNETTGILVVKVYAEPGLKWYNLIFNIDTSLVDVKSYNSGAALTNNARTDFAVSTDLQLPLDDISYSNGTIEISTEEMDDASTDEEVVCRIKMKLKNICKEEEIPNSILSLESINIKDENDDYYDDDSLVQIHSLRKGVTSISVSDVVFEKDRYGVGDTINIASGTLTINYDNSGRNSTPSRTVDLATLKDTNGISVDVVKGGWTAVYPQTTIKLTYEGKESNGVTVPVYDKVIGLRIEDRIQKQYEYGADQVNVNDSKVYISLKSGRILETTLASLIESGKAEIEPDFASFATPKTSVTQQLTITISLPEFDDYVASANLVEVTVLPEGVSLNNVNVPEDYSGELTSNLAPVTITDTLQSIDWVEMPENTCKYGKNLDTSKGKFEATYKSGQKSDAINISNANVTITEMDKSAFDNTNMTTRNLLVTYNYVENGVNKSKTLTYQITIEDYITDIEFVDDMDKTYEYGETAYKLNNSTIRPIMASGAIEASITLNDLITIGQATITPNLITLGEAKKMVTKPITITINIDNFEQKQFTRNITVYDPVTNIELIQEPNKKIYEYGETPLVLDGGIVEVTYKSTQKDQINMPNEKISVTEQDNSQFDSTIIGKRDLKVTYSYTENGVSKTNEDLNKELKYEIEVKDKILDIELINDIKPEYEYGDNLDIRNTKVIIKKASGDEAPIDLQTLIDKGKATIEGFDSTLYPKQTATENLTIKFNFEDFNYTKTINNIPVTIKDKITKYELDPEPDKKIYEYNESLDVSGGKIKKTYKSGEVEYEDITKEMVTELDGGQFDSTQSGTRNLKVTYQENVFEYEITVKEKEYEIYLNRDEIRINYGHEITNDDLSEYKIIIEKNDGTTMEDDLTKDLINYNKNQLGEQIVYIKYQNYTKQLPFHVIVENYLEKIELSKNEIKIGLNEDIADVINEEYKIIPIMANGDRQTPIQLEKDMIIGEYDNTTVGTYNVKVKYNDKYADLNIVVEDRITNIRFDENTMKKTYKYGEDLDLTGANIIISKLSGDYIIELNKDTISNFKLTQVGHQEYDLAYYDYIMRNVIKVEVEDYIVDVLLVKPDKTTYKLGEELDLTGCALKYVMASGNLGEPFAVTEDMISGYESEILGTQRIKVTFENYEKYFDVIITPQTGISGISAYSCLIMIIEMSIIGIFMTLALQKKEKIENIKNVK